MYFSPTGLEKGTSIPAFFQFLHFFFSILRSKDVLVLEFEEVGELKWTFFLFPTLKWNGSRPNIDNSTPGKPGPSPVVGRTESRLALVLQSSLVKRRGGAVRCGQGRETNRS